MPYFYEVLLCRVDRKEYFEKILYDYINTGWKLVGEAVIENGHYKQPLIKHY
jgi:hypothetical protein